MPRRSLHPLDVRRAAAARAADLRDRGDRGYLQLVADDVGVRPVTVRQWIVAFGFFPTVAATQPTATTEGFPLRGVVWHRTCVSALHPGHTRLGDPVYVCPPRCCPRPLRLPADAVHGAAINALSRVAPGLARRNGVPDIALVAAAVRRLTIGANLTDLGLIWAHHPRPTAAPPADGWHEALRRQQGILDAESPPTAGGAHRRPGRRYGTRSVR